LLTGKIKERFDSLGVVYKGTSQGSTGMITSTAGKITTPLQYYFHSDHLGSSSLITDINGNVVQHLEYIPFGEVFIDERPSASSWSTPYKFNAKELDEETGLYYYGARYYDPRVSVWLGVDPLAEKMPNVSSYVYCLDNPVNHIDPDGRDGTVTIKGDKAIVKANIILYAKNGNVDAKTVKKFQNQIQSAWSKDENGNSRKYTQDGKTYNVSLDVKVSAGNSNLADEKNRNYNGENNYINVVDGNDLTVRSFVNSDMHSGEWSKGTNEVYHEFGHLLGLHDRYHDVGNKSVPDALIYKGNVMGAYGGKVDQININGFR